MLQIMPIVIPAGESTDVTWTTVVLAVMGTCLFMYVVLTIVFWLGDEPEECSLWEYIQGQYRFLRHLMTRLW